MGFSSQEDWSGLPCPPPGHLPDAGMEPVSLTPPGLAGGFFTYSTTWEATGICVLPIAGTFLKMRPDVCYVQLKKVMAKDPAKLLIQMTMGEETIKEGLTVTRRACSLPAGRAVLEEAAPEGGLPPLSNAVTQIAPGLGQTCAPTQDLCRRRPGCKRSGKGGSYEAATAMGGLF